MCEVYNVTAAHITRTPGVSGGKPCIAGTRIKVQNVYIWYELMGQSPDEIANAHDLNLAQIHAALTYAFEHLDEIREDIAESNRIVEEFKRNHPDVIFQSKRMSTSSVGGVSVKKIWMRKRANK